jgi:beta-N-acetylhexosaminidase
MTVRAFITGLSGTALTPAERAFLREIEPWGLIVFQRNVETPAQLTRLTAAFRDAVGRDAPVLVDQEGGRVQRLGPPHWPAYPAGAAYGRIYDRDPALGRKAAYLGACLIAADLVAVGIDVDCLPIADVPVAGANSVIGDRAYGERADKVAALGRSVADGLLEGGVLPVLKHVPGHGRATVDSHDALPLVETDRETLANTDFAAFRPLCDLPLAMTAHVVYSAIDPIAPATTSVTLVRDVIRGWLGFRGLLMSDDISMGALSGPIAARTRAAIVAGCDVVLHCNGDLDEMRAVASAVPALTGAAAERSEAALARRGRMSRHDLGALRAEWAALMDVPADAGRVK